jgi:4-oxalocrotonate tautomerase
MPVVTVELLEGRTPEQKRRLVRAITDAMVEHAGARPDALHVILHEVARENWGRGGVLTADADEG